MYGLAVGAQRAACWPTWWWSSTSAGERACWSWCRRGRRGAAGALRALPRHGGRRDRAGRGRLRGVGAARAAAGEALEAARRGGRARGRARPHGARRRARAGAGRAGGGGARRRSRAVAAVGDEAGWEALRLERGRAALRRRLRRARRTRRRPRSRSTAVSFDKGCYLGQEVVCMLEMRGHVKRKLVSVVLDAGSIRRRGRAGDRRGGRGRGRGDERGAVADARAGRWRSR